MSDSLRDQLLKAGFKAPKSSKKGESQKKPAGKAPLKGARGQSRDASGSTRRQGHASVHPPGKRDSAKSSVEDQTQIGKRKAIKARIKALIEADAIREFQGESVYRFMVNRRIRELHVKDELRAKLVEGSLSVTRLNGSTWLVPAATAAAILQLNPDWVVVTATSESDDVAEGYEDFPVPDDLQW